MLLPLILPDENNESELGKTKKVKKEIIFFMSKIEWPIINIKLSAKRDLGGYLLALSIPYLFCLYLAYRLGGGRGRGGVAVLPPSRFKRATTPLELCIRD